MLYTGFPEAIHLITESLFPLTNISLAPPLPHNIAPENHHSTLWFYEFNFFRFHI